MRAVIASLLLCCLFVGCNGAPPDNKDEKNVLPVYEAVLRDQLSEARNVDGKGDAAFFSLDHKDPPAEVLKHLQKTWPNLQPGSKAPERAGHQVGISDLKWLDRDSVELKAGWSNGMDGHRKRYRLSNKDGKWVVQSAKTTAIS